MDAHPAIIAAGALVLAAAGYLVTRGARRRADPGDFEQRLEDLRRGRVLAVRDGAVIARAVSPAQDPDNGARDEGDEEADLRERSLPPAPTLESFTAPPPPVRVFNDPDLGEFTFDPDDSTWQQDNEGGAVPWYHIEAGPEGPTEAQRRCLATFIGDEQTILDRALDGVFATIESRGLARPVMEVASLYVEAVAPGESPATGRLYFRIDGYESLPANAASTDDWVTLACDVDSSLRESN